MNCARLLVLGKRGLRNVSRNGLLGMLPGRRSHYHMHVIGGASERLLLVSKAHELRGCPVACTHLDNVCLIGQMIMLIDYVNSRDGANASSNAQL